MEEGDNQNKEKPNHEKQQDEKENTQPGLLKGEQESVDTNPTTSTLTIEQDELEEWKRRFREQLEKAEIKAEQRTPLEKIIDCLETFVEWDDFLEEQEGKK